MFIKFRADEVGLFTTSAPSSPVKYYHKCQSQEFKEHVCKNVLIYFSGNHIHYMYNRSSNNGREHFSKLSFTYTSLCMSHCPSGHVHFHNKVTCTNNNLVGL